MCCNTFINREIIDNNDFWKLLCARQLSLDPHQIFTDNISKQTYKYISGIFIQLKSISIFLYLINN